MDVESNLTNYRSLFDSGSTGYGILVGYVDDETPDAFLDKIRVDCENKGAPAFLSELARLAWHVRMSDTAPPSPDAMDVPTINPTLQLLLFQWQNLAYCLDSSNTTVPAPGPEYVVLWKHPRDGKMHTQVASPEDLLALKMIAEDLDRKEVSRTGALSPAAVDGILRRSIEKGIIIAPMSGIRRDPEIAGLWTTDRGNTFMVSPSFTLQWHITQACDLHCRHCYDRSNRSTLTLDQAVRILDDMEAFCHKKHVAGHISFTGGNPLLHPHFTRIYKGAAERGFSTAILGNPTSREKLEELIAIQPPNFFQASLEGLPDYNDFIRGEGHFEKTMNFLDLLRDLGVYSMVMLTLTQDNLPQVLPLGARLQGKTDVFYFNRLAQVGEGASLNLPGKDVYRAFLEKYVEAAKENAIFGLKDNLINTIRDRQGAELFGGCTGFGCGAAFNFLSVLSDGEVHACRKFPSVVGNIFHQTLEEIYDADSARLYRSGSAECRSCPLRPVCGGCLACAYSHGLDIFNQKDPYCFYQP